MVTTRLVFFHAAFLCAALSGAWPDGGLITESWNFGTESIELKEYLRNETFTSPRIAVTLENGAAVEIPECALVWIEGAGWVSYASSPQSFAPGAEVLFREAPGASLRAIVSVTAVGTIGSFSRYVNVFDNHNYFFHGILVHNSGQNSDGTYDYSGTGNPHSTTPKDDTSHGSSEPPPPCGGCDSQPCSCAEKSEDAASDGETAATVASDCADGVGADVPDAQKKIGEKSDTYLSAKAGDPVLVASGIYVFQDTDLGVGRTWRSDSRWSFSTDQRIVRGLTRISGTEISETRALIARIDADIEIVRRIIAVKGDSYAPTLSRLAALRSRMQEDLSSIVAVALRTKALMELNAYALSDTRYEDFSSSEVWFGNDNVAFIDEDGAPTLFLYCGGGIWKPQDPRRALDTWLESADGIDAVGALGFILHAHGGVTKYFDRYGLIEKIVELDGSTTRFVRSNSARDVSAIQAPHNFTVSVHCESGRITGLSGPEGLSVQYAWVQGMLASVTDVDGDTIRYEYSAGRMCKMVKSDGSVVAIHFGYDGSNSIKLVSSTVNEEQATETFEYNPSGHLTVHTGQTGLRTLYRYDDRNRTTELDEPDGTVTLSRYDSATGLLASKTVNGDTTCFTYDSRGNVTCARYSDRSTEESAWDAHDQKIYSRDRDGYATWTERNSYGNVTAIQKGKSAAMRVQSYAADYDEAGRRVRERFGDRNEYHLDYDGNGYVSCRSVETGYGSASEKFEYDRAGRLRAKIDANGRTTRYGYRSRLAGANRVVTEFSAGGLERTCEWNGRKDLVCVTEKDSVTGETRTSTATYDRRHLPVSVTDGGGCVTEYSWCADGKLESVRRGNWKQSYRYDAVTGQLKSHVYSKDGPAETGGGSVSESFSRERMIDGERLTRFLASPENSASSETTVWQLDRWGRVVSETDPLSETSIFGVTSGGRLSREQLQWGGFMEYAYDPYTGSRSESGKEGRNSRSVTYNPDGTMSTSTDENGNTISFSYDGRGLLLSEKSPTGTKSYGYDAAGRPVRTEVRSGESRIIVEIEYADDGRTVTVTEGGRYSTKWFFNAWGECIAKTDGEGNTWRWKRDGSGNIVAAIDACGNVTSYVRNAIGLVESVTTPGGNRKTYEYDCKGLLVRVSAADGVEWQGSYDCAERLIAEKSWPGIDKEYRYDACGRLTGILSGGEVVEEYVYSDRGKRLVFNDGKYALTRNGFGLLVGETNGKGDTARYAYDARDRLVDQIAFSGKETRHAYQDEAGRETVSCSDGTVTSLVQDLSGLVVEAVGSTGTITYRYDEGGRLIEQADLGAGATTTYRYDRAGRRVEMKSGNRDIAYTYDSNGNLSEISDNLQRLSVSFKRDSDGRELCRTYGNGVRRDTRYDASGRIIVLRETDASGKLIWGEGYRYDAQGRKSYTINESGDVEIFQYDRQSRLSTVLYPYSDAKSAQARAEAVRAGLYFALDAGTAERYQYSSDEIEMLSPLASALGLPSAPGFAELVLRETYSYDKRGNRIAKTTSWGTIRSTYDQDNNLCSTGCVSYEYDKDGNLIAEKSLQECKNYEYTDANRMKSAIVTDLQSGTQTATSYAYDAFCRRTLVCDEGNATMRTMYDAFTFDAIRECVAYADGMFTSFAEASVQTVSTTSSNNRYAWVESDSQRVANNPAPATAVSSVPTSRFTGTACSLYVDGLPVASNRAANSSPRSSSMLSLSGGIMYFGCEPSGSVRTRTDDYSRLSDRYDYDSFGSPYAGDFSAAISPGYTGKPYDPATGLYNYGFRDYSPSHARFTTLDPIRDGTNWFAYVNNDPVNWVDLTGLQGSFPDGSKVQTAQWEKVTFRKTTFTSSNPVNQLKLDQALGINSNSRTTKSCQTTAMVNAYAAQNTNGITGNQILDALTNSNRTLKSTLASDGSPSTALSLISKDLAKASGRNSYLSPSDIKTYDLNSLIPNGAILGYSKTGKTMDVHFGYIDPSITLDSMDPNRPEAANYQNNSYRVLTEKSLCSK